MELSGSHRRLRRTHPSFGRSDKEHTRPFREPSDVSRDHAGIDPAPRDPSRELGDDDRELRETILRLGGARTELAHFGRSYGEADR